MDTIGSRIQQVLTDKDLTPYKLHKGTGIAQSTIGRIIKGENIPNRSTINVIADYLDVTPDWIATGQPLLEKISDIPNMNVEEPSEQMPNKAGNVFEELPNGRFKIWTKKIPVKAFASYISEFRNAGFIEELESVAWTVDRFARGRYATFESEGDSMNGGGINDTPDGAELLGRELQKHHWRDGFRESIYGWVIVHKDTILHKDIIGFDNSTGDIICHSRSGLPQHPDFTINLNDVLEVWKVIKRSF